MCVRVLPVTVYKYIHVFQRCMGRCVCAHYVCMCMFVCGTCITMYVCIWVVCDSVKYRMRSTDILTDILKSAAVYTLHSFLVLNHASRHLYMYVCVSLTVVLAFFIHSISGVYIYTLGPR